MTPRDPSGPEIAARRDIDASLEAAGWVVQNMAERNLAAGRGVAVREFPLPGHGYADYLLFVDKHAVGVLEAKPKGHTLSGVEPQVTKYAERMPAELDPPISPLPFLYLSTGVRTKFTNLLDPDPRSRPLFSIHKPETLADWLADSSLDAWVKEHGGYTGDDDTRPSTLRARLRAMPELDPTDLFPNQIRAIHNLDRSLAAIPACALTRLV